MKDEKDPQQKSTLDEDDIEVSRERVGRRAALRFGGLAVAGSGLALATGCGRRRVVRVRTGGTGITDNDPSDPVGNGRGGGTGITDNDPSDAAGYGRGGGGTGITDADSGGNADPAGYGRGGGRMTDSDGGPCADPAGGGRGHSGRTDSDGGRCADPAGRGRY